MNERRENISAEKQCASYDTYNNSQRYRSRSGSSKYGNHSTRYGADESTYGNRRRVDAREPYAPVKRSSFQRNPGMQRSERRSYTAERNVPVTAHSTHGASMCRTSSGNGNFFNTILRYLYMANTDILGRCRWKLLPALYLPLACFYSEILLGLFSGAGLPGCYVMPQGEPDKRYTPEFKQMVVETMEKEYLSVYATMQEFRINDHKIIERFSPVLDLCSSDQVSYTI